MNSTDKKQGEKSNSSEIKEISVTPFLTKLLTPSADLIGGELRDYLKEKIDTWKEKKRGENIVGHVSKVQSRVENKDTSIHIEQENIAQLDLFSDWVEGAQDIEPESGDIADLWQELLLSIAKGDAKNKILIEKLKQVNAEEAAILLRINRSEYKRYRPQDEKDFYHLQQLENAGLVTRSYAGIIRMAGFLIAMLLLGWSMVSYIYAGYSSRFLPDSPLDGNLSIFVPGTIGVLVCYAVMLMNMRFKGLPLLNRLRWPGVWYLSWIGEQLTKFATKEKQENQKV
jgi:hypothetical protein